MPGEPSYFDLFDLPERLELDRQDLDARYHALARAHHPDRFVTKGPAAQSEAAERMERINRAYRTLKDPWERTRYVLSAHGADLSRAQVPVALAEEYFEIQETREELR
ncbi:MAG TPA: Fe-S protein assembly co-chaperone HscB, partial [Stenomitos sp.]